jgi:hypothetical protein
MGRRKRIRELEQELEQEREDYQHSHDTLWKILTLLCTEFGLNLSVVGSGEDDDDRC